MNFHFPVALARITVKQKYIPNDLLVRTDASIIISMSPGTTLLIEDDVGYSYAAFSMFDPIGY